MAKVLTEQTLFWDVFNEDRDLAISKYNVSTRYRFYYRTRKATKDKIEAWSPWIATDGDFGYVYGTYQGMVGTCDLLGLEYNTLFYECDKRSDDETLLIGSVQIEGDDLWRFNMFSSMRGRCTIRDLALVEKKGWCIIPNLRVLESVSEK